MEKKSSQLIIAVVKTSSIQKVNVFNDNLTKIMSGSLVCYLFELYARSKSDCELLRNTKCQRHLQP